MKLTKAEAIKKLIDKFEKELKNDDNVDEQDTAMDTACMFYKQGTIGLMHMTIIRLTEELKAVWPDGTFKVVE